MNEKRRQRLRGVLRMLSDAEAIVSAASDQESDALDNYPENLQGSERYERTEDAAENLDEALDRIGEARDLIQSAIG